MSMSINRESLIGPMTNGEGQIEGLMSLGAAWKFRTPEEMGGEIAKNYEYNLDEAHKLFSAAGVELPIQIGPIPTWNATVIGPAIVDGITLITTNWKNEGIAESSLLEETFGQFVARLNKQGHTVLLTTHYLEEAEALCSRIAMLKQGRVVALDRTANLLAGTASTMLRFKTDDALPPEVAAHARVTGRIAQVSAHDAAEVEVILGQLRSAGVRVEDLEIGRADLEDVFLEIMASGDGKPVSAAPVHLPGG